MCIIPVEKTSRSRQAPWVLSLSSSSGFTVSVQDSAAAVVVSCLETPALLPTLIGRPWKSSLQEAIAQLPCSEVELAAGCPGRSKHHVVYSVLHCGWSSGGLPLLLARPLQTPAGYVQNLPASCNLLTLEPVCVCFREIEQSTAGSNRKNSHDDNKKKKKATVGM